MIKKYAVAGLVSVLLVSGVAYKSYRYGYDARDSIAVQDQIRTQDEIIRLKEQQEEKRKEAESKYQGLKDETENAISALSDVNDRLRDQARNAIRERDKAKAASRTYETGADWIGAFASCHAEYDKLGKDAARIADKLRGLQVFVE